MSCTYIRVIDRRGEVETVDEIPNSSRFYIALWGELLRKFGIHDGYTHDLRILGQLWSRVAKVPRPDGLVIAATFDRCWFPRDMLDELTAALHATGRNTNGPAVARALSRPHFKLRNSDRGVTFSGSIASPWACQKTDGLHRVDKTGHACADCGTKIQRADHTLADIECCSEPDEAAYVDDRS